MFLNLRTLNIHFHSDPCFGPLTRGNDSQYYYGVLCSLGRMHLQKARYLQLVVDKIGMYLIIDYKMYYLVQS